MATQANIEFWQKLYVAYYGRPADRGGLNYWAERADSEGRDEVIDAFGTSPEFQGRFGDLSQAALIDNLYQQLFGREAEPAGLTYYTDLLESGEKTLPEIALTIGNAAQDSDKTVYAARTEAASAYTEQAGGEQYALDYAKNLLQGIDGTNTQADLEATLEDIEQLPDDEAQTFTLTPDADQFTGGSGNDTVRAPASSEAVFNEGDNVDGGAGWDELVVEGSQSINGAFTHIETATFEGIAAGESFSIDAQSIDGLEQLQFTDIDGNGDSPALSVANLTADQTVNVAGSAGLLLNLNTRDDTETANLSLDEATGVTLNTDSVGATAASAATQLNLAIDSASSLRLGDNEELKHIAVAGSGALSLSGTPYGSATDSQQVSFEASQASGDIEVINQSDGPAPLSHAGSVTGGAGNDSLGALDSATNIATGNGNDRFDLSANTQGGTVSAGSGDDTVTLGSLTDAPTIDAGDGSDSVVLSGENYLNPDGDGLARIDNAETLVFTADQLRLDASQFSGYDDLVVTGDSPRVENLTDTQTLTIQSGAGTPDGGTVDQSLELAGSVAETVNLVARHAEGEDGSGAGSIVALTVEDDPAMDAATLNLGGNGNFRFNNGMTGDESFVTIDAADLNGSLTLTTAADQQESILLGEDNANDTLQVAGRSNGTSMDVVQHFDSTVSEDGQDAVADGLTGIFGAGDSASEVALDDSIATTDQAFEAAAGTDGYAHFTFEGNTYIFNDNGATSDSFDDTDFTLELSGTHDLSSDNAASTAGA